jgi:hypothetical protein
MTPQRHTTGPPSTFTPELGAYICDQMWRGRFLTVICSDPDMPDRRTVLNWAERYPDFRAAYQRARMALGDAVAEEAIAIADDNSDDVLDGLSNPAAVARAKLRCDVRRWIAAKFNPAYSQAVDHGGEVIHRHLIDRPPDETREQWLQRRRAELALPPLPAPGEGAERP